MGQFQLPNHCDTAGDRNEANCYHWVMLNLSTAPRQGRRRHRWPHLLLIASGMCATIACATGILLARSYWRADVVHHEPNNHVGSQEVCSASGKIALVLDNTVADPLVHFSVGWTHFSDPVVQLGYKYLGIRTSSGIPFQHGRDRHFELFVIPHWVFVVVFLVLSALFFWIFRKIPTPL